jgi:hypothetical protein
MESMRIDRMKSAVETLHTCNAKHVGSERVIEMLQGKVGWQGIVEVFEITGHPHAKRCYAWSFIEKGEPQYVTVLEIPPVDSAEAAVNISVVAKARELAGNAKLRPFGSQRYHHRG